MRKLFKPALVAAVLLLSTFIAWAINEIEPNNSLATAQTIALGDAVTGRIANPADQDWFKVKLKKGAHTLTIVYPLGTTVRDWFDLVDANNQLIEHACYYPNAQTHLVVFKVCSDQDVFLKVQYNTDLGASNADYSVLFNEEKLDPRECEDTAATAFLLTDPATLSGKLALKSDVEWFKMTVAPGPILADANTPGVNLPMALSLYRDPAAAPIATGTNSLTPVNVAQAGTYYLKLDYVADTAVNVPYLLNLNFFKGVVVACDTPKVGISRFVDGKDVFFSSVVQNGPVQYKWEFGDGTTSTEANPIHSYNVSGKYMVSLAVTNNCATAIATTEVTVILGTFRLTTAKGKVGDIVLVALLSENFNGNLTSTDMQLTYDPAVAEWVGTRSGKADTANISSNRPLGILTGSFGSGGSSPIAPKDTILKFLFRLKGKPGDSTGLDLNGSFTNFYLYALAGPNNDQRVSTTLITGGLSLYKDVWISTQVKTSRGVPLKGVTVDIVSGKKTYDAKTDSLGFFKIKVEYADSIKITPRTDNTLVVTKGINSQDAWWVGRIIVLLPISGSNDYSIFASDVDCNGAANSVDQTNILRFIVQLIPKLPCAPQVVYIPENFKFLSYPNANFYKNVPFQKIIVNPNADKGETAAFVAVTRGDVSGDAKPYNFTTQDAGDRSDRETKWLYRIEPDNGLVNLRFYPSEATASGTLNLHFDATTFKYAGTTMTQFKNDHLLVVNDKASGVGQVKLAFLNRKGENSELDPSLPFIEMAFRPKSAQATDLRLSLSEEGLVSQTFTGAGENARVVLEQMVPHLAVAQGMAPRIFPNPARGLLFVSLPDRGAAQIELFDNTGRLMTTAQNTGDYQVKIPVTGLPSGAYHCRVTVGNTVTVHKVVIAQ